MKALITFALANEFAAWRRSRHFKRLSADAWDQTYRAQVGAADVRVVLTGAGRFAAQQALARAFDHAPDVCIASGFSGALKPAYRPGVVLAARTVADVDGTRLMRSDAELISRAAHLGAKVVERFLTSDRVVSTAEEKNSLGASGDAVDMESVYVLSAAAQREIPSVAIRAISERIRVESSARFRPRIQRAWHRERSESDWANRRPATSNWRVASSGARERAGGGVLGEVSRRVRAAHCGGAFAGNRTG